MARREKRAATAGAPALFNRPAFRDFELFDRYEAGLVLVGSEVKSLRQGRARLKDAFARLKNGELYLHELEIAAYPCAAHQPHELKRPRKLLLRKRELRRLTGKIAERGYTMVPIRLFFNERGFAKVEIALARGKARYDKRQDLKRREQQRDIERALKDRR